MVPEAALLERFSRDVDPLIAPGARVGIAVSGGADSLALLLLAAASRPGRVEAATVDHRLRDGSREEADMVAGVCERLGVPHTILTVEWDEKPVTAIQERARTERYRLLAGWAQEGSIDAITTAHHADDQAETLIMRLARGAGVRGLAAMRPSAKVPGAAVSLIRPLLGWRRADLEQVCLLAGLTPAADPSNEDEQYERVRVRRALKELKWLDAQSLSMSAAHLSEADVALDWASAREWASAVTNNTVEIVYRPTDAPAEIRRRIVSLAIDHLAAEGKRGALRGKELEGLLVRLERGGQSTLRGVRCSGGSMWIFKAAPARRTS